MKMKDPREFTTFDDDPRNNGFGYDSPNTYDDPYDEDEEDEGIPLENEPL